MGAEQLDELAADDLVAVGEGVEEGIDHGPVIGQPLPDGLEGLQVLPEVAGCGIDHGELGEGLSALHGQGSAWQVVGRVVHHLQEIHVIALGELDLVPYEGLIRSVAAREVVPEAEGHPVGICAGQGRHHAFSLGHGLHSLTHVSLSPSKPPAERRRRF